MSEKQSPFFLAGMSVLSVALVISAWLGSQAVSQLRSGDQTVSVTGSARKSIQADFAIWRSASAIENPSQQQAYTDLRKYSEQIKTYFLQEKQVPPEALKMGAVQISALPEMLANGNPSGKIRGFKMVQNFEIQLSDVKKIERLAEESTDLIQRGVPFESFPPEYLYTHLGDLRVQMLSEATADARQRAEQILKSAGSRLGPVRSVRTGVFQITRPHSTEVSDYGMYDTSTIEKDITAVLTLSFAVQ
jgi:hypothetical protein